VKADGFAASKALPVLVLSWTLGIAMLVASPFGAIDQDRFRRAPTCSQSQLFTSANCRSTVDATMTALTRGQASMVVGGREVSAEVMLHGPLTDVAGLPVRATFYQGILVHIQSGDLNFDTAAAPESHVDDLRFGGLFFLVVGTFTVGVTVLRNARRAGSR
jgi:hypothetical protein